MIMVRMTDSVAEPLLMSTPPPQRALRQVRSTLLVASLAALRDLARMDEYLRALPPELHASVLEAIPGTWMPVATAIAHYRACDTLGCSYTEGVDIGRRVFDRLQGTLLGTAVRLSKNVGVTPWTVIPLFPRFWTRLFDGSAMHGWRRGPKEARIDILDMPLCDTAYFRNALCGQGMGVLDLFCGKSYVGERKSSETSPGRLSLRVQWA
jgi:hypothetical protein